LSSAHLMLQSLPGQVGQIPSPDYAFPHGFVSQGARPFPNPNVPYHEQAWRIPEAGTPGAFAQYPPPPSSTTSQFPGAALYAFSQPQREQQFAQTLRSNSSPWDMERGQYSQMAGGAIPVSAGHGAGQGLVYSASYSQTDAQHQYATSPTHYPGGPGPYMPHMQEHWQQYGPGPAYIGGRHDSAYTGTWAANIPISSMDPNHHANSGGSDPYRKGSNHPS